MRLTWKIRRKLLRILVSLSLVTIVLLLLTAVYMYYDHPILLPLSTYFHTTRHTIKSNQNSFMSMLDFTTPSAKTYISHDPRSHHDKLNLTPPTTMILPITNNIDCTMGTCFNITRCLNAFSVYVYPPQTTDKVSPTYQKFLKVLRESPYYSSNPKTACILVLSLDTLDRDILSTDFTKKLPVSIRSLPHWNDGQNHLIFNLYTGSFPNYFDELDFPVGQAILARASFSASKYRQGFDVSLPLVHRSHSERGKTQGLLRTRGNLFPVRRKYRLVFKGKRYLWGFGSATRNGLHHLNNDRDILILTTCKHGRYWGRHKDERCARDNALYNKYDYHHLISNSTFCLVPRGRRLGSFRFLESMRAGCIPVSLSNGLVLPFHEYIDWSKAIFSIDERQLFQIPHLLNQVSDSKILSMRLKTQFYWEEYFSSVEKIIRTTLEIIKSRIQSSNSYHIWNNFPGSLASSSTYSNYIHDYPFYSHRYHTQYNTSTHFTAVILVTQPAPLGNSPLVILLKNLCNSTHLGKVILSWVGSGNPKVMLPPQCSAPVIIKDNRNDQKYSKCLFPLTDIDTPAVLSLWENSDLITEEIDFGLFTWLANPHRIVGYTAQRHFWSPVNRQYKWSQVPNNRYSLVSLGAAFYHRYYGYYIRHHLSSSSITHIMDSSLNCFEVAFNSIVSDLTGQAPLKMTQRTTLSRGHSSLLSSSAADKRSITISYSHCINSLMDAFGYNPLSYSWTRADPVLFKDNVSVLRKEFHRMETID